jgi:hypothetical protein
MKGLKSAKLVLEARQPRLEASVLSDGICNSADGETENHSKQDGRPRPEVIGPGLLHVQHDVHYAGAKGDVITLISSPVPFST